MFSTSSALPAEQSLDSLYACEEKAESEYNSKPNADWDDVKEVLGDDLVDVVGESLCPDAISGKDWLSIWNPHCKQIFEAMATGDHTEVGRLVCKLAIPSIVKSAQFRLEMRAQVKSDIDDLFSGLDIRS